MQMETLTAAAWRCELRALFLGIPGSVVFSRNDGELFFCTIREPESLALAAKRVNPEEWAVHPASCGMGVVPTGTKIQKAVQEMEADPQTDLLAARLLKKPKLPLTEAGIQMIVHALKAQQNACAFEREKREIRRLFAEHLRKHECSGQFESGLFLAEASRIYQHD